MESSITLINWLGLAMFAAFVFMMGMWMHCATKNATQYPDDWDEQEYWNQVKEKESEKRQNEG